MVRPERLTRHVLAQSLWGERPLFVLDVGVSGGLDDLWNVFEDRLRAVGFDALVAEVERLNAVETRPGVRYEAALVGCRDFDERFPPSLRSDRVAARNNDPFTRVSASAAQERFRTSYVQEVFNAGAEVVVTDRRVSLDDVVDASEYGAVDFVKVDTDGHDIEVLLGAERLLAAGGALGVMVEAQFHGPVHEAANTFGNIDRIMRGHGFTLFDIDPYRYSRAALPAPFAFDLAAQTVSGQVLWGDAVYFRDLGDPLYDRMWPYEITRERVLKLACLFERFRVPDCAAELLVNRGDSLEATQRDELLDLLVPGEAGAYRRHVEAFDRDFESFYPSRLRAEPPQDAAETPPPALVLPGAAPAPSQGDADALAKRLRAVKAKNARLAERLESRDRKIERLVARVQRLEAARKDAR